MTAAAAKIPAPVLRNAAGEPPLGVGGLAFRDDQGEMFYHDRERAPSVRIGVLELESGSWLAQPPSFAVDGATFNSRDAALIFACDTMVEKARRFMAAKEGEGTHWTQGYGGRVIEWALSLKPEHSPVQVATADAEAESDHPVTGALRYKISVQFSGGAASYVAAKLILDEFGHDGVALIFADTLIEDEDLYRFLQDAENRLQHPIIRISEGRDPWTVFFDERMMGNSRVDPCSKILKRKLLDKWRAENCTDDCTLVIGYDASEDFRFQPLKARMAPVNVRAPLLEQGIWKEQAYARVEADGLVLPRLYKMGFPHNNCGGFCVKAGHGSFALLLENLPERYAQHEAKEEAFRQFIGKDVSIMRDRRGGTSKPLTMRALRERLQTDPASVDRSDIGGCTCMEEPDPSAEDDDDRVIAGNASQTNGSLNPEELTIAGYEASDAGRGLSDPVVNYLVEQYSLRKQFPAKHIFSMTTDVADGRIVSIATCACKQVFKFGSNDYLRMNAAIEAHWRRFGHEKTVDGMGHPIGEASPTEAKKPKCKTKSKPGAGGLPAPIASAPTADGGVEGADASIKPAEISASSEDAARRAALTAIAAGEWVIDPQLARDLIGEGLVHATATRLLLTEEGEALLKVEISSISLPPSDDPEFLEWKALSAIDAHIHVTGPLVRHLIDRGLVVEDIVDGRLVVTDDDGMDRLAELTARFMPAPIGAGSDEIQSGVTASPPRQVAEAGQDGAASASASQPAYSRAPADPATVKGAIEDAQSQAPPAILSDDDDLEIEWPSYDTFLEDKIVTAPIRGIEVARDTLHPWLKPHCKDLTLWALRLGCAAIFANFGLHKTAMQLEWCRQLHKHVGGATLNVVPLGVRHGFIKEAVQLDMDVRFIRTNAEFATLSAEGVRHFLTNYESIREGKLDPNLFIACSLDEASVLRSYGSKTFQEFLPLFAKVEFKLVATATPSPNRYKELIHYAGFLGVMDTGLALTRWFQRNSEKAGDLTLYPHKEAEFWMWVHSWAAFLQRPSELGYSDEGYELPPLKLTWHEVPADHSKAEPERDGQGVMFRAVANSLSEAAKARRDSLAPRVAKMMQIIAADPDAHRIIWHDLEAEREAIEVALPEVVTISGSMDIDDREVRLHDFEEGRIKYFGTKPILSGSGSNFQYHCHKAIYLALPGYGYKFNDFLQSLYRLQRFGQQHPVEVDIIYAEDERSGRAALEEKWARDAEMRARMSEIILAHGLNTLPLRDAMLRTLGVKRVEISGENFRAINNDAVAECRTWPDNSVDQIVTSIPFSNHYEYSASYRDFGHTDDNGHFWGQMDFLTCELLRMLKPGRLACIHVKDRVLFGSVTGEGVPTISPFHAEAIMHYRAHGFQYMGMIHINTDVVRENNQTYRLGWSECAKDGTKMGVGSPEYVLLLRKRQSDRTRGYADVPVVKDKETYSRARWQIDAHAFWRSSGNRLLTPEEFATFSAADLARSFAKMSTERVYDYEAHVKIGEDIDRTGSLPATFMAIAPGATQDHTWHDVNRMRTLNMLQQRKGAEQHLCPLQFDIVDRLIERFSNEGDLVFDPFGGLMTVPYRAILKKRKGAATELSSAYFLDGVHYLHMAEEKMAVPEMFDLAALDAANTPPPRT